MELVACKDIPYKTEPRFKPIYSVLRFVDGRSFRTLEMPQDQLCRFHHKHVFLVGAIDHVLLREQLATKVVEVELHDCDEYIQNAENEADARFSVGKAKFTFRDFLRPWYNEDYHTLKDKDGDKLKLIKRGKELKLRSDVFPLKREQVDNTQNLDLNTTARKNEKTVERCCPYLINATHSIVIATLARPIGPFDEKQELALWREEKKREREAAELALKTATPT